MGSIDRLLHALDELTIAQDVARHHDDARNQYRPPQNSVTNWRSFQDIIAEYYDYHFCECISHGGHLPRSKSLSRAEALIEQEYRRRNGDIVTAYKNALNEMDRGLLGVLDIISEGIKAECIREHVEEAFRREVARPEYEQKVHIIRQLFRHLGPQLSKHVQLNRPERYANDYQDIISSYVEGLRQTSSIFRRI